VLRSTFSAKCSGGRVARIKNNPFVKLWSTIFAFCLHLITLSVHVLSNATTASYYRRSLFCNTDLLLLLAQCLWMNSATAAKPDARQHYLNLPKLSSDERYAKTQQEKLTFKSCHLLHTLANRALYNWPPSGRRSRIIASSFLSRVDIYDL
jgi:hypothetical protein